MKCANETVLLAADSGGTKTEWRWLTPAGETLRKIVTAGVAALHPGTLPVRALIGEGAGAMPGTVPAGIYFSLGGPNVDEVRSALESVWPGVPLTVEREASGDLVASCRQFLHCEAVVMAGTGVTAMGFSPGGTRKFAEGWGPLYGDLGAGGGIGLEAVRTFLRGVDGTADPGRLAELFREQVAGLDLTVFSDRMELKARVNALTRRDLAALAPQVMALAVRKDAPAAEIIARSARHMAELGAAVAPQGGAILMLGGLFKLGESYRTACAEALGRLRPDCRWVWDERFSIGALAAAKVLMQNQFKINEAIWRKILDE